MVSCLSVCLVNFLDNRSSGWLHTWHVYCRGPKVQRRMWRFLDEGFSRNLLAIGPFPTGTERALQWLMCCRGPKNVAECKVVWVSGSQENPWQLRTKVILATTTPRGGLPSNGPLFSSVCTMAQREQEGHTETRRVTEWTRSLPGIPSRCRPCSTCRSWYTCPRLSEPAPAGGAVFTVTWTLASVFLCDIISATLFQYSMSSIEYDDTQTVQITY